MRQLIINVPDAQYSFFRKLLQQMPWAEIKQTQKVTLPSVPQATAGKRAILPPQNAAEQEWVDGMREAFQQSEDHASGKRKLRSAYELLDEL